MARRRADVDANGPDTHSRKRAAADSKLAQKSGQMVDKTLEAATSAPKKNVPINKPNQGRKRVREASLEVEQVPKRKRMTVSKPDIKVEAASISKKVKKSSVQIQAASLNEAPRTPLDIYVFGNNEQGQLGLGAEAGSKAVRRPRLNPKLLAAEVKVVQIAVGGMHCAVLTADNKILTWGVNDQGALGRDTTWGGGMVDMKDGDADSDDEESSLNPHEAAPKPIDDAAIPKGTVFVQVAASDNATFALTDQGLVYGWGTFLNSEGKGNFSEKLQVQKAPVKIEGISQITKLAAGDNHILALDRKGAVWTWGDSSAGQLGRRVEGRLAKGRLVPDLCLGSDIAEIGCGPFHSFAITKGGRLYAWGLNNFGQTGINDLIGESNAYIQFPRPVRSLNKEKIVCAGGGNKHSIAVTKDGRCLTWGVLGTFVTGHDAVGLPEKSVISNERRQRVILKVPTALPGLPLIAHAGSGTEHCIAVAIDGRAFSWGFSDGYRTGLGTEDDVETPTLIDNTATRGKQLIWTAAGGSLSILAGIAGQS